MDASMINGDPKEVLERLTKPFFDQGTSPVFVASCCGRLYAGIAAPTKCRHCGGSPASVAFSSMAELDPYKIPTGA